MRNIQVHLDIKPLSVNYAWQGRRFRSPKYKQYERDMMYLLPKQEMITGDVEVTVEFFLKNALRSDADNPLKPLLDILTKAGYWEDDRKITDLHVHKRKAKSDSVRITITPA